MVFLDSNIWLYALISLQDAQKTSIANNLIRDNRTEIVMSSQVIIEVCVNLLRKGSFTEPQVTKFIKDSYQNFQVVDINETILLNASDLRAQYSLSYFDSIIVSAALESNSRILFSEDMHDGLVVEKKVTIRNPFSQTLQLQS
jgi:predicted nucleic acid-binding protein